MAYENRQAWIDSVRQAVDIVAVVGRHVALKRKGRHWWGLCPFHAEKTPSFSVDPEQQLFYCFGCQKGGTVFTFLTTLEGREFKDVVDALADEAGIPRPDDQAGNRPDPHQRLRAVVEWTQQYFQESLRRQRSVVDHYLESRGVDLTMVEKFQVGYAPDSWHGLIDLLQRRGVSVDEMVEAGVAVRRDQGGAYDRWRGRLVFPIWDRQGQIVAFGGRSLASDQEPKYLNSPDTPLFKKGHLLYGAHVARPRWRKGTPALIVEGYFDVVACHQAEQVQAVGQLGTALTEVQARYLARYVREVDLLLDQDAAGLDAMRRAFLTLSGVGLKVNLVALPPGCKDPSELVQKQGVAALAAAVSSRRPYLEREVERMAQHPEAMNPRGQAEVVDYLKPLIRAVADPIEQAGYLDLLAKSLRISPHILSQSFRSGQERRHANGKNGHNIREAADPVRKPQPTEIWLLAALKRHPDHIERVKAALPVWAGDERVGRILENLTVGALPGPDEWPMLGDPQLEALYAAIWQYDEPESGAAVIDDLIWTMERDQARRRYEQIKELLRSGTSSPELMDEIRHLADRLEWYQSRKEG